MSNAGIRRRTLLSAGAALGVGSLVAPRWARAQSTPWGELSTVPSWMPAATAGRPYRGFKVLEIFFYGGLSPWETFYRPQGTTEANFSRFDTELRARRACAPDGAGDVIPFTTGVDMGRLTKPLFDTTLPGTTEKVADRMRVVVHRHDLLPHQAAIPFAMSGLRLGNARMAGMGAPVQRRVNATAPSALPSAYVFLGGGSFGDNFVATTSVGMHGMASQPLVLETGEGLASTIGLFQRTRRTDPDALAEAYRAQYEGWLTRTSGSTSRRLRSRGFDDFGSVFARFRQAPQLHAHLSSRAAMVSAAVCNRTTTTPPHQTAQALNLAAHVLKPGGATAPAMYAGVVDGGIIQPAGATYDGHAGTGLGDCLVMNFRPTIDLLCQHIADGSIDLSDTLVLLTTEFGRTLAETRSGGAGTGGRDHWPEGYASVLVGGPLRGRSAVGRISGRVAAGQPAPGEAFTTGSTPGYVSPTELRAAVLYAAGINPLAEGAYVDGDFSSTPAWWGTSSLTRRFELVLGV